MAEIKNLNISQRKCPISIPKIGEEFGKVILVWGGKHIRKI